jgi:hypothetical protein
MARLGGSTNVSKQNLDEMPGNRETMALRTPAATVASSSRVLYAQTGRQAGIQVYGRTK